MQVILNGLNHPTRKTTKSSRILLTKKLLVKKVQTVQKVQTPAACWETSRIVLTASWAAARRADESRQRRCAGDPQAGSVKPDQVRDEVRRLEDERLRLAPEVMVGNPEALERDKRLEARIRELAGLSREERAAQLREAWLRNHPGGDE